MDIETIRKYLLPPGVVLSITLIGLVLLGAVLYSKADRAQRFLEPTLAISRPRTQFTARFSEILGKELPPRAHSQIVVERNSIKVRKDLLFPKSFHSQEAPLLRSIGRVFLTVMEDPQMSPYVDFIMVLTRFPGQKDHALNVENRSKGSEDAGHILSAMFAVTPELEENHSEHFASSSIADPFSEEAGDMVEFHIIPSERVHIDLLIKLQKYLE
jgi:hypothetical protein